MWRALENLDSADGVSLVESQLLGALIICPYLRLDCQALRPADFSSHHRGEAFAAIMAIKHPELGLVVAHLEAHGATPPPGRTGWGDALSRVLDLAFVEDDAIPEAVRAIKGAAIERKMEKRLRAVGPR